MNTTTIELLTYYLDLVGLSRKEIVGLLARFLEEEAEDFMDIKSCLTKFNQTPLLFIAFLTFRISICFCSFNSYLNWWYLYLSII